MAQHTPAAPLTPLTDSLPENLPPRHGRIVTGYTDSQEDDTDDIDTADPAAPNSFLNVTTADPVSNSGHVPAKFRKQDDPHSVACNGDSLTDYVDEVVLKD